MDQQRKDALRITMLQDMLANSHMLLMTGALLPESEWEVGRVGRQLFVARAAEVIETTIAAVEAAENKAAPRPTPPLPSADRLLRSAMKGVMQEHGVRLDSCGGAPIGADGGTFTITLRAPNKHGLDALWSAFHGL
jgi:hypothetical protein